MNSKTAFPGIRSLYTPIERAVLATYLNHPDAAPQELAGIDVTAGLDPELWDEDAHGIAPLTSETGYNSLIVENAVARICLQSIQAKLPQWAVSNDGRWSFARRRSRRKGAPAPRRLQPFPLFTINWADSGPGFSWPEAYHVTALPGYDVCIVTGSADSPEAHGYCDFAIGWFLGEPTDIEKSGECIRAWWYGQKVGGNQERWVCLFGTAAVDSATAERWANEVWPPRNTRRRPAKGAAR